MLADIRYAFRGLLRAPGFALVAVLSLALGIGANTAIFTLVNAILLRTLPVHEPNRLVLFTLSSPDRFGGNNITQPLYRQIRDHTSTLEQFAAITGSSVTLSDGHSAEYVDGAEVSGNFFQTLGLNAALGRTFTPDDGDHVCVISQGLWLRRFGGDPSAIGRKVLVNSRPFTILGVTPKEFRGFREGEQIDVTCAAVTPDFGVVAFGRLRPGVSLAQAQAELDSLYHRFAPQRDHFGKLADMRIILQSGRRGISHLVSQYEKPLLLLTVVAGLTLLIACANITNLLMARASARAKEIAVRRALGASRAQLMRQLVAESMLLAIGGSALGIGIAFWTDRGLLALAPAQFGGRALVLDINPDWRVLLFTLSITIAVTLLNGIAPIQFTQPKMDLALKGGTGVGAPRRFSLSSVMVVVQVAGSLMLLIGAGLFLRSLLNLKAVDPDLDPQRLIVLTMEPPLSGYSPTASLGLFDAMVARARRLPGVLAVSPGLISPLSGEFFITGIKVPDYQTQPHERQDVAFNAVGPEYFKALGTPLVSGRVFTPQDGAGNKVAIVNEKLAAHYWPHQNPLGKRVVVPIGGGHASEVVGVVKMSRASRFAKKRCQRCTFLFGKIKFRASRCTCG